MPDLFVDALYEYMTILSIEDAFLNIFGSYVDGHTIDRDICIKAIENDILYTSYFLSICI